MIPAARPTALQSYSFKELGGGRGDPRVTRVHMAWPHWGRVSVDVTKLRILRRDPELTGWALSLVASVLIRREEMEASPEGRAAKTRQRGSRCLQAALRAVLEE